MTYLFGQIVTFLVLTAILWTAVGWWLRRVTQQRDMRALTDEHAAREQALTRARDELRDQLEQVSATRQDGQLTPEARRQIKEHVRKLELELNDANEQLLQANARLEAMQIATHTRDQEYEQLRARLDETKARLERAPAKQTDASRDAAEPDPAFMQTIETQAGEIQALRERIAAASAPASKEHARLLSVIQAQKRTIEELNVRAPAAAKTSESGEHNVAALRAALRQRDAEIGVLRDRIKAHAAAPTLPKGTSGDLFPQAPKGLRKAPDGEADDLKKINGIGPVLEARLNELGVFHFRQIADFTEKDIGWIASKINAFPNRILRDNWVAQAARLSTPD
ncbi:MAG: hypothetical protein AAF610_10020 [Pseudomonadota bacterium]